MYYTASRAGPTGILDESISDDKDTPVYDLKFSWKEIDGFDIATIDNEMLINNRVLALYN